MNGWLAAGALALAALCSGVGYYTGKADGAFECRADNAEAKTVDQGFVIEKQAEYRQEEGRRDGVVESVSRETVVDVASAAASAAVSDGVASRLRVELDTIQRKFSSSQATCDTRVAQQRETAAAQFGLLTDLYRESDKRAGELAKEAEGYRTAGLACEKTYDGVRNSPR